MSKRNKIIAISLLFLTLAAGAGYSTYKFMQKRDFDLICRTYSDYLNGNKANNALHSDPHGKLISNFEIAQKINRTLVTSYGLNSYNTIMQFENSTRYENLVLAAKMIGYNNWNCPEIQNYYLQK